jgi:outer membrane lipoprotein carrier protein
LKVKNCSLFTVHRSLGIVYCSLFTIFFLPVLFAETVDEIVYKVQETYDNTQDLEATFTQESLIKTMDKIEKSEGKVYIKKPGKMRWDYKKPKIQEIVIEGGTIWIYQPEQRQVMKAPFSNDPRNRTPVSFLYGVGRLKDDFEIKLSKGSSNYIMALTPKGAKGNIEKIFLEVDSKEFNIVSFSLFDIYGNKTTITFKDIKVNKGLKDSIFKFKVPDVIKVIE